MAEGPCVPDGTEPLEVYVRREAAVLASLGLPPDGDPQASARRSRRRDRRQYLALCRLLRRPAGTPLRLGVSGAGVVADATGRVLLRASPGAPILRVAAPDRAWLVPIPAGRLDDRDWDVWRFVRRELRRAVEEADVERLTRALLGPGEEAP